MARNSVPATRSGVPINVSGRTPIYQPAGKSSAGAKTNPSFLTRSQRLQVSGNAAPASITPPINRGPVAAVRSVIAGFGSIRQIGIAKRFGQPTGGQSPNSTAQDAHTAAYSGSRSGPRTGVRIKYA